MYQRPVPLEYVTISCWGDAKVATEGSYVSLSGDQVFESAMAECLDIGGPRILLGVDESRALRKAMKRAERAILEDGDL